ncbi:MAG TPA: Xaa-Pro peptidase family protein [Gaiellaceae bacterium]|nr:Xaa-Pro peptidase family protein [Gaiellaceae bacterium]
MPDALIYADSFRSPELRHEVPLGVPDPFLYVERDGTRHVVASSLEAGRLAEVGGFEVHPYEEFGFDELRGQGLAPREVERGVVLRALETLGVKRATVPHTFPVWLADALRERGVELDVDAAHFDDRRRVKTAAQLEGMRRAQRAAEAGMDAARDLLRRATRNGAGLVVDGEPLTVERLKSAIGGAFVANGAVFDDFIVAPGAQGAMGHEMGSGPIEAGVPIVIDVWPRDARSFVFCDMTRTFVVGEVPADVRRWHALCREALERTLAEVAPGANGRAIYDAACDVFEAAGEPTQRTKEPGVPLGDGFFHGLGHGVGLEVHEAPGLGLGSKDELRPGDVVTLEPGAYRRGYGGVRLEDLVLVTEDGHENLTTYPYDLEP